MSTQTHPCNNIHVLQRYVSKWGCPDVYAKQLTDQWLVQNDNLAHQTYVPDAVFRELYELPIKP